MNTIIITIIVISPCAIFADHSNLLLLGLTSFAAAASMALTLASCLSHLKFPSQRWKLR